MEKSELTKTKKKYLLLRRHASGTGGGPCSSRQLLTALEERVVAVLGVSAVFGQAGIEERGLNKTSQPIEEPSAQRKMNKLPFVLEVPHTNINPSTSTLPETLVLSPQSQFSSQSPPTPTLPLPSTSVPPTQPPPLPLPQTPAPNTRPQGSASLRATTNSPHPRVQLGARRNRGQIPFDRATSDFVAVEQQRLEFEESRDRRLHEREMERLRVESQ